MYQLQCTVGEHTTFGAHRVIFQRLFENMPHRKPRTEARFFIFVGRPLKRGWSEERAYNVPAPHSQGRFRYQKRGQTALGPGLNQTAKPPALLERLTAVQH